MQRSVANDRKLRGNMQASKSEVMTIPFKIIDWKSLPIVLKCPVNWRAKQMRSFERDKEMTQSAVTDTRCALK